MHLHATFLAPSLRHVSAKMHRSFKQKVTWAKYRLYSRDPIGTFFPKIRLISLDILTCTAFLVLSFFFGPGLCSGYWQVWRGRQYFPMSFLCFSHIQGRSSWSNERSCARPDLLRRRSYSRSWLAVLCMKWKIWLAANFRGHQFSILLSVYPVYYFHHFIWSWIYSINFLLLGIFDEEDPRKHSWFLIPGFLISPFPVSS